MRMPVCLVCAALVASGVQAQVLVSRTSTIRYSYSFAGGSDIRSGGDTRTRTDLMPNGDDNLDFADSVNGTLPSGEPYSAGGNLHAHYHFDIPGFPNDIDGIHFDGLVHAHSMASGAGTSSIQVSQPGNENVLEFGVYSPIEFHLNGSVDSPVPVTESYVALQRKNGENWETLVTSLNNPEGRGPIDAHGPLVPGRYRMISHLVALVQGEGPPLDVHCMYNLELPGFAACRADFNGDGIVDFFDYLDFVSVFSAGTPEADFNLDGTIDFFDYLDFVAEFSTGCN